MPFELREYPTPTLRTEDEYLPRIWKRSVYPTAERLGVPIKLPSISPQPYSRLAFVGFQFAQELDSGVGVAGSNPVIPTNDFPRIFYLLLANGSRYFGAAVPETVPVLAGKIVARFRLSLEVGGRSKRDDPEANAISQSRTRRTHSSAWLTSAQGALSN